MPTCSIKVEAVLLPAYAQKTGKTTDEIAAMLADETSDVRCRMSGTGIC